MAGGTDWEDTRNIYQGPRRFKERTISNEHNNWGEKPLEGTNSRMREAAEQRSELEDRIAKTAETEQPEENRIKRNDDSIMEKAMAPHSSSLACKIPWTEELGGLQSLGLLGVRQDWVTSLSLFTLMHWRRKWQPTPVFLPGGSQG